MNDTNVCPECGGRLPAQAPQGLCPRCLMGAVLAPSGFSVGQTDPAEDALTKVRLTTNGSETIAGPEMLDVGPAGPPGGKSTTSAEDFRRTIVELEIMDSKAIDRHGGGPDSEISELVRSLVQAQALTTYQACAIRQGKARGLVIGRYLILDKLGEGGMGVVFKARHRLLNRVVALKILPPSFARKPDLVHRFRREMQAAGRLSHPNVVAVTDADQDRGVYFLAMEYVEGRDLDHLVRDHGPLPVEQALSCAIQAARGLEAAHARGIVHRDIKPANLMLDASGTVRVLDLGLARLIGDSSPLDQSTPHHLTRPGIFMGTVDFMAPEQAEDLRSADQRADIYSLGCSLYFLLTGRPPFEGNTAISRLVAHQELPAPSIRSVRPEVPESLEAAYLAMMAKRALDRPQSMTNVIALLSSCRLAASGNNPSSSLESYARTVLLSSAPAETQPDPAVFAARHEPDEFGLKIELQLHDTDRGERTGELSESAEATAFLNHDKTADALAGFTGHRRALLVAGCLLVALTTVGLLYFAKMRGGGAHSPVAATGVQSIPIRPQEIVSMPEAGNQVDAVSTPPEPRSMPVEEAVVVKPAATPKPRPEKSAPDRSARAFDKAPSTLKPKLANVPAYDATPIFTGHTQAVNAIAVSRDGKVALSAGADRMVWLWDVATGKEIFEFPRHPSAVQDAALSPDGRFALTATKGRGNTNGTLRLWNLRTRQAVFNGMGEHHLGGVQAVAFAGGGRAISGGQDGQAMLWNLASGRPVGKLGFEDGTVRSHALAVFPDKPQVLTGGENGIVHVWNILTRKQLGQWKGHEGPISVIAISSGGLRAATGSHDHSVILWNTVNGSQVRRFLMPGQDRAKGVAILPDGNVLAAGGTTGHLVLWDSMTGAILRQAQPPFVPHNDLAILPPDGRRVLTADEDGAIRLWTPRQP